MNSREFLHQVAAVKGQTDMAEYVSLRDQRRMKVTVPPIDEQRRIAAILGALDDKIELQPQDEPDAGGAGPGPLQVVVH
jgi:type I restriction enzyme S subunit